MAEHVTSWQRETAPIVDVRPDLERGDEPFVRIMEAAETVDLGASFTVIAPFEPVPLYSALQARGFRVAPLTASATPPSEKD